MLLSQKYPENHKGPKEYSVRSEYCHTVTLQKLQKVFDTEVARDGGSEEANDEIGDQLLSHCDVD